MISRRGQVNMKRKLLALAAAPALLFVLFDIGVGAEHKSVLWPWIDTVQAPGYSERSFQTIRVGMTRRQVDALMCKPLTTVTLSPDGRSYVPVPGGAGLDVGLVRYSYTSDGRCRWGDFAWQGREVWFKDGVVTQVFSDTYDD